MNHYRRKGSSHLVHVLHGRICPGGNMSMRCGNSSGYSNDVDSLGEASRSGLEIFISVPSGRAWGFRRKF